jgi:hypothetical protein
MRWMFVLALLLSACSPGPYPVDIYPEMHYSPAQRRGEPTRLSPSSDAVPVSGRRPAYSFEEASLLRMPVSTPDGAELYRVNCAMCHASDGHAQTRVAEAFRAAGAVPPVDLASARVRERSDGQLLWIVANGLGGMPPFGSLLREDELWRVVRTVRQVQGQP